MDFRATLMKILLLFLNTLYAILGTIGVVLYSVIILKVEPFGSWQKYAFISLLVLSFVFCIIAIFGCLAVLRESHWMLTIYSTVFIVLWILQFMFLITMIATIGMLKKDVEINIFEKWQQVSEDPSGMNTIQRLFKCCGLNGPKDYGSPKNIPKSCCFNNGNCLNAYYQDGCKERCIHVLNSFVIALTVTDFVSLIIKLIVILFACFLAKRLREISNRTRYHISSEHIS